MILAVCAAVVGFALVSSFGDFLRLTPSLAWNDGAASDEASEAIHDRVAVTSTLVALAGIGLAAFFYLGDRSQVDRLARWLRPLYELSLRQVLRRSDLRLACGLAAAGCWPGFVIGSTAC